MSPLLTSYRALSSQPLRGLYAALALVASLAATKAMVWPLWPHAAALDPQPIRQALQQAGIPADPLPAAPSSRSAELATSSVLSFRLADGQELRLMQATARERFNLQNAFVSRNHPDLQIEKRTLSPQAPPSLIGSQKKRLSRQTCLVSAPGWSGGFGVTRDQLTPLSDQMAARDQGRGWRVLLGLTSNRDYRCTLISVRSRPGQAVIAEQPWRKLLDTLQASLSQPSPQRSALNR